MTILNMRKEQLHKSYNNMANVSRILGADDVLFAKILAFSELVYDLDCALLEFASEVKFNTRGDNRSLLSYMANTIADNMRLDFESLFDCDPMTSSGVFYNAEFEMFLEQTRIKSLYESAKKLRDKVGEYDKELANLTTLIKGVSNDK